MNTKLQLNLIFRWHLLWMMFLPKSGRGEGRGGWVIAASSPFPGLPACLARRLLVWGQCSELAPLNGSRWSREGAVSENITIQAEKMRSRCKTWFYFCVDFFVFFCSSYVSVCGFFFFSCVVAWRSAWGLNWPGHGCSDTDWGGSWESFHSLTLEVPALHS